MNPYTPNTDINPGVRKRLETWLLENADQIEWWCMCCGLSGKRLWSLATNLKQTPTLHEALSLELISENQIRVYDWLETSQLKAHAIEAMKLGSTYGIAEIAQKNWPPFYDEDNLKRLRWELARRLTRPQDNILGIVVNMGAHKLKKSERARALAERPLPPIVLDPGATEEEFQNEVRKQQRRRDKRAAYRRGIRADFEDD